MSALSAALWLLGIAAAMGVGLAAVWLMGEAAPRVPAWPGWVHGAVGATGIAATLLALRGPARGVASGAGSFGTSATTLLVAALAAGGVVLLARLRRKHVSAAVVAIHAMLAVAGYVMLAAWAAA